MKLKEFLWVTTHLMIFAKSGINSTNKAPAEKPITAMAAHTSQTFLEVKMRNDAAQHVAFTLTKLIVLKLVIRRVYTVNTCRASFML